MKYRVVIEKDKKHYRAIVPAIPGCIAKGRTKAEALDKIQQVAAERLSKIEVTTIEVNVQPTADSWEAFIGVWRDDPTWEEFQTEMAAYREKADEEADDA